MRNNHGIKVLKAKLSELADWHSKRLREACNKRNHARTENMQELHNIDVAFHAEAARMLRDAAVELRG